MTMQKVAAEKLIQLVIAGAIAAGIALFVNHYQNLKQASAQNDMRGTVMEATDAGIKDGQDIDAAQQMYAKGLADAREGFKSAKQEAIRNEPQTADRAVRPVPDSVRAAYRERRRARERLECAGSECEEGRQAGASSQREGILRGDGKDRR